MSTATITGRLVADAELRYLPSGVAVLKGRVADNHRKKDGDNWEDDGTSFWDFTLWRDDAETNVEVLTKGTEVIVTGEPRIREWEKDGVKQRSPEINRAIVAIRKRPARSAALAAPKAQGNDDPWSTGATTF